MFAVKAGQHFERLQSELVINVMGICPLLPPFWTALSCAF